MITDSDLEQFTGTQDYHKWSILFPKFALTDGAKYLADTAQCYWLMDMIASHARSFKMEQLHIAKFKVNQVEGGQHTFTLFSLAL